VAEKFSCLFPASFPNLMNVTTMSKNKQNVSTMILFDTLTQANDTFPPSEKENYTPASAGKKCFIAMLFGY
jgi:hypothetical protein